MEVTKNQHYVSQGILKNFADEQKKTYELFIEKSIISKKSISKTMSQNYVYEHPEIETNTIENFFAKFEGIIIPIIDSIISLVEENIKNDTSILGFIDRINKIIPFVLLFYFRSGALLIEYAMDSENPRKDKVERMLQNIFDVSYIFGLKKTICECYDCAVIYDEEGRFLLSDQYVSTVALKYKCRFSNASNRQIGMKDTMILLPLSSKLYVVFYEGRKPCYIKKNQISKLCEEEVQKINDVIFQNSYVKCVGKSLEELERVKSIPEGSFSPTKCILFYDNGSAQNRILKKEVFFYEEDRDMFIHFDQYASIYKTSVERKIERNSKCVCGSGKKYKNCCLRKYEEMERIIRDINNPRLANYTIEGVTAVEESILEYYGPREKMKNKNKEILKVLEEIINEKQKT